VAGGFDRRIVAPEVISFLQACGRVASFHVGGGAALAGVHLRHRLSADTDLFVHDKGEHRHLVRALPELGAANGTPVTVVQDAGSFVRGRLALSVGTTEVDVVFEPVPDLESAATTPEGVAIESLADLRANKLTCILSRSEPRDLVDLMFLDRAGYPPERDLVLALRKDAGIDPGTITWLLRDFPTAPLPIMLVALTEDELRAFRDDLRERFRRLAVPPESR
jgi:Nucleotidyl transferase AbiEii toxin, Type IV TA system